MQRSNIHVWLLTENVAWLILDSVQRPKSIGVEIPAPLITGRPVSDVPSNSLDNSSTSAVVFAAGYALGCLLDILLVFGTALACFFFQNWFRGLAALVDLVDLAGD